MVHGGGFAGCDSFVTLLPDEQVAVVFLSNKNRKWPGIAVSQDIAERTLAVLVDEEPQTFRINYDRLESPATDDSLKNVVGHWKGKAVVGGPKSTYHFELARTAMHTLSWLMEWKSKSKTQNSSATRFSA